MISNSTIIVLNILSLMAMLMSALPSYNNTDMAYYNAYAVQRQLSSSLKGSHEKDEKRLLNSLTPLKNEANIMFWRPQKVGSSTMLSLLISYGFRYNMFTRRKSSMNGFCRKLASCVLEQDKSKTKSDGYAKPVLTESQAEYLKKYILSKTPGSAGRKNNKLTKTKEAMSDAIKYKMSTSHELCFLPNGVIKSGISCAWNSQDNNSTLKEIFQVREPVSRALSVYYFWGELFKLKSGIKNNQKLSGNESNSSQFRLGNVQSMEISRIFRYHGDEKTPPPEATAIEFAKKLPYNRGMPGPSKLWSAFAADLESALKIMRSGSIFTVVTERMDESLVAMRYYLGWSLADIVVTKPRKALSSHPKADLWPPNAVNLLKQSLIEQGETSVYEVANDVLSQRISELNRRGIDVNGEITMLVEMRNSVTQLCMQDEFLIKYRDFIDKLGFPKHPQGSSNHLRDTEDKYGSEGHSFSINREILYSYDLCGSCEAHAILFDVQKNSVPVSKARKLAELTDSEREENVNFAKCPN